MNNNDYNFQDQNGQKEEIKFDDRDFANPYSRYYRPQNQNGFGADFKVDEEPSYTPPSLINEEKEKRNFTRIGVGYALLAVITNVVALILCLIVKYTDPIFYQSTLFLNIVTPASIYLFALPVLLIVISKCEAKPPQKKKLGFGAFLICLITAFGFMYLGSIVGNYVMELISESVGHDYSNGLTSIIDYDNLWITAIFTVIVAPIGEEFVFRKLLIDRTQKYGGFVSIGLSGLMFGLMHGNLYQFFYCFALGILLGYIYYSTGKLYLTIAIHAIVNFVGSVVSPLLIPVAEALDSLDFTDTEGVFSFIEANLWLVLALAAFSLFTYVAMACGVIFPIAFRKKLKLGKGELELPGAKIMPIVIMNYGVIAMLIVYLFEFGMNLLPI